jgi:hypothetical protein
MYHFPARRSQFKSVYFLVPKEKKDGKRVWCDEALKSEKSCDEKGGPIPDRLLVSENVL